MSHIERIDHPAQVDELLLSQFDDSPIINALNKSWVYPLQLLEDDLIEFMDNSGISLAKGEMLNILGSWMGVERQGRLDEDYRTAILGRALAEGMDGTTEKFYEGFRVLINSDQAHIFNLDPQDLYAVAGAGYGPSLQPELKRIAQAGTRVNLVVAPDLDYMHVATRGEVDNILRTDQDEPYEVLIDGVSSELRTTVVTSAETYGTTTTMGWSGVSFSTEAPIAFRATNFKIVESGLLVDNEDTPVVDDQGNQITILNYSV